MEETTITSVEQFSSEIGPRRINGAMVARLLGDWLSALSTVTRLSYGKDLQALARFLGVQTGLEAAERLCLAPPLDARDLALRFKTHLRDAGSSPATVNRRLSTIRSLYKHVVGASLVVPSMKAAARRRVQRGNATVITRLLTAAAAGGGVKALRDVALLMVLHDSGLRRAEAASLRVGDLDLEARTVHVRAKGHQGERVSVDVSMPAIAALRAYLSARGPVDPEAPLFISVDRARKGAGGLSADGIHALLFKLSERAGLSHIVSPHDVRRAGARALAKSGADVESLRSWGRWGDYRTPARYVGECAEKGREAVDLLAGLRQAAV
jgi:site-specific recombinase XerD